MTVNSPIAWLNNEWVELKDAKISPLDRGFLFGDAVYEVVPVAEGTAIMLEDHLRRLGASLSAAQITNPHSETEWCNIVNDLISRNMPHCDAVYLQVSRGTGQSRSRNIPTRMIPTVFGMTIEIENSHKNETGYSAVLLKDSRWLHCDIKSTSQQANVLLEIEAARHGADEALMIRDGYLTEGTSSSVIVVENDTLLTRPAGPELLPGTTVHRVREVAIQAGISCREELVSETRLRNADEIWIASATRDIVPIVLLDGRPVGSGKPGPLWQKIAEHYAAWKQAQVLHGKVNNPTSELKPR